MGAYDCDCINNLEYDRRERKAQLSKEGTTKGTTSDLISRTETVKHLRRVLDATVPITDYDEGYVDGVQFAISTVSTMPPAQPEPKEGHWIPVHPIQSDDPGAYMCSKCKTGMWEIRPSAYHYCPNCGARMKGERQK
jgi:hypothetical protein